MASERTQAAEAIVQIHSGHNNQLEPPDVGDASLSALEQDALDLNDVCPTPRTLSHHP